MKKFTLYLLIAILAVNAVGCGSEADTSVTETPTESVQSAAEPVDTTPVSPVEAKDFDGREFRVITSPNTGVAWALNDRHYTYDYVCGAVIKAFRFELRDIAKYLRMTKIAAYKQTHNTPSLAFGDGAALEFCLFSIVPVMIGLMLHDMQRYTDFITGKDYTPLLEVKEYLDNRVFVDLLDRSETFDPKEKDKAVVTVENKIKAVYEAIFITQYSGNMYQTTIGGLVFYEKLKNDLLRITGLLSDFSDYDYEERYHL